MGEGSCTYSSAVPWVLRMCEVLGLIPSTTKQNKKQKETKTLVFPSESLESRSIRAERILEVNLFPREGCWEPGRSDLHLIAVVSDHQATDIFFFLELFPRVWYPKESNSADFGRQKDRKVAPCEEHRRKKKRKRKTPFSWGSLQK